MSGWYFTVLRVLCWLVPIDLLISFRFKDVIQQVLYSGSILIARDSHGRALRSIDAGITWIELASATDVQAMVQSQSDPKRIVFLSSQTSQLFTPDGGETMIPLQTPLSPAESSTSFVFHATEPESFLFIGTTNCLAESDCKNVAFVTTDRGRTWNQIETYAPDVPLGSHCVACDETRHGLLCRTK